MKAIRVHSVGDADVMLYEDVPLPEPGRGEACVKIEAAGLNFIDIIPRRLVPSVASFHTGYGSRRHRRRCR